MKIHDDHLYHGAALIQIAENEQFTAINSLKIGKKISRVAYRINDDIAVFFKYASDSTKAYGEYVFTFTQSHLDDLESINKSNQRTYIALVCVSDREICCLSYDELMELIHLRESKMGSAESSYTILVTAPKGKSLRVYVNSPNKKKMTLGTKIVNRNKFPNDIFANN